MRYFWSGLEINKTTYLLPMLNTSLLSIVVFLYGVNKASHSLNVNWLPNEVIEEAEKSIKLIRLKYNKSDTTNK